jgi:hypothetical protein
MIVPRRGAPQSSRLTYPDPRSLPVTNNGVVRSASCQAATVASQPMSSIVPRVSTQTGVTMKYMISWTERPQGSPIEYENAQKRILEVFTQWKAPSNFVRHTSR